MTAIRSCKGVIAGRIHGPSISARKVAGAPVTHCRAWMQRLPSKRTSSQALQARSTGCSSTGCGATGCRAAGGSVAGAVTGSAGATGWAGRGGSMAAFRSEHGLQRLLAFLGHQGALDRRVLVHAGAERAQVAEVRDVD